MLRGRVGRISKFGRDPYELRDFNREPTGWVPAYKARLLWLDAMLIEIPARTVDEPIFLVVGRIHGRHWSAVVTYRDDRVRIISVRRARIEEVEIYEGP